MPIVSRVELIRRIDSFPAQPRAQVLHQVSLRARKRILRMASIEKSIHVGSSLSSLDILAAILLGRGLRRTGDKPTEKDWLILSKGHAVPALYALLVEQGKLSEKDLDTIRDINGLEGHPDNSLDGVDVSTGSLGQGLSIAAGIAFAMCLDRTWTIHRVFVVLGDGELDEGQVWEAAATIAHLGLSNIVAIVDVNGFQLDGATSEIKDKGDLAQRWRSLGWRVIEIDGHNHEMILEALAEAEASPQPVVIIAYTRRGNGLGVLEATGGQHV